MSTVPPITMQVSVPSMLAANEVEQQSRVAATCVCSGFLHKMTEAHMACIKKLHTLTDAQVINFAIEHYPELFRLAGRVHGVFNRIAETTIAPPRKFFEKEVPERKTTETLVESPSKKLFGEKNSELDRTIVTILALKWIYAGNYDQFTKAQPENGKLSLDSFNELRFRLCHTLTYAEAYDSMIGYVVISSLKKVEAIRVQIFGNADDGCFGDNFRLTMVLSKGNNAFQSFARFCSGHQEYFIRMLGTHFEIGQFIRGEIVPENLNELSELSGEILNYYFLHVLLESTGNLGDINPAGSAFMTESNYQVINSAISAIEKVRQGRSVTEVYDEYLDQRGINLNLTIRTPFERAALRICLMLNASSSALADQVISVLKLLPESEKNILLRELNISGVKDGSAIVLNDAGSLLISVRVALFKAKHPEATSKGLEIGLLTLARLFREVRAIVGNQEPSGVFRINIGKIALAAHSPETLSEKVIQYKIKDKFGEAVIVED